MALDSTQKASRLFKKSFGAGETNTSRDFFEEPYLGRDIVLPGQIWSDADLIPTTAPLLLNGQISGVVQYIQDLTLTAVSGTTNSFYHATLKNSIPFNYGDGTYNYILKNSSNTVIPFGQGDWLVDNTAGVLTFYGTVPSGMPPKISFYKYVGGTGVSNTQLEITLYNNTTGNLIIGTTTEDRLINILYSIERNNQYQGGSIDVLNNESDLTFTNNFQCKVGNLGIEFSASISGVNILLEYITSNTGVDATLKYKKDIIKK